MTKLLTNQVSIYKVIYLQSNSDRPQIDVRLKRLNARLPKHSLLKQSWVQILLGAVQTHELLILLKFASRTEIGQLIDRVSLFTDVLHDVAGL